LEHRSTGVLNYCDPFRISARDGGLGHASHAKKPWEGARLGVPWP
jgi:hypothetical protein